KRLRTRVTQYQSAKSVAFKADAVLGAAEAVRSYESIHTFFRLTRLQCPDCMLAERAGRDISALAKALSCSHLRSCDSRATCHFDHWGSIQENRWKAAIPGAGQFQAMSFAASFRRNSVLWCRV